MTETGRVNENPADAGFKILVIPAPATKKAGKAGIQPVCEIPDADMLRILLGNDVQLLLSPETMPPAGAAGFAVLASLPVSAPTGVAGGTAGDELGMLGDGVEAPPMPIWEMVWLMEACGSSPPVLPAIGAAGVALGVCTPGVWGGLTVGLSGMAEGGADGAAPGAGVVGIAGSFGLGVTAGPTPGPVAGVLGAAGAAPGWGMAPGMLVVLSVGDDIVKSPCNWASTRGDV